MRSTCFITCLLIISRVSSHSFIIAIDGANGVQSSGFGTRLTTRGQVHQYTGIITDKEINAHTVGPCGRIFGGENFAAFVIDPNVELSRAEASGIPTTHEDGSINMGVFVHNADGSGPFHCDYSPDASLHTFAPMKITRQIEGVKGINRAAKDYVYPLTAAFYPNATCTGGKARDTCIIRCRNPLGFGSCAALRIGAATKGDSNQPAPAPATGTDEPVPDPNPVNGTAKATKNTLENPREALDNRMFSKVVAVPKRTAIQDGGVNVNNLPLGLKSAGFDIYKPRRASSTSPTSSVNQLDTNVKSVSTPRNLDYKPMSVSVPLDPADVRRLWLKSKNRPHS